jgi:uncharacterized protein YydD (DUF2326 family)
MKSRVRSWLGSLLAPAEDPRRGAADSASVPDAETLLAELRRSRSELAQLRAQIEERTTLANPIATDLAEEEHELLEAEQSLLLSLDERRARAALLRAADARVRAEF